MSATTVIQCETCGDAAAIGFLVFPLSDAPGPLYACASCGRYQAGEHRCAYCGRFMRLAAPYACPMQEEDGDVRHEATVADLYECKPCRDSGHELCWFDAAQFAEHQAEYEHATPSSSVPDAAASVPDVPAE